MPDILNIQKGQPQKNVIARSDRRMGVEEVGALVERLATQEGAVAVFVGEATLAVLGVALANSFSLGKLDCGNRDEKNIRK